MFANVIGIIVSAIQSAQQWAADLFNSMPGVSNFIIAFFAMFLSYRCILKPLLGSAPSSFHENRLPRGGVDVHQTYSSDVHRNVYASPPGRFLPPPSIEHKD